MDVHLPFPYLAFGKPSWERFFTKFTLDQMAVQVTKRAYSTTLPLHRIFENLAPHIGEFESNQPGKPFYLCEEGLVVGQEARSVCSRVFSWKSEAGILIYPQTMGPTSIGAMSLNPQIKHSTDHGAWR